MFIAAAIAEGDWTQSSCMGIQGHVLNMCNLGVSYGAAEQECCVGSQLGQFAVIALADRSRLCYRVASVCLSVCRL